MIDRQIWTYVAVIGLTGGAALCQVTGGEDKVKAIEQQAASETRKVADQGLERLKTLASGDQYSLFGFRSRQEVDKAELATAIPIFDIGTEDLLNYKPGADISGLLTTCSRVFYPVASAGQVRSSISVVRMNSEWQVGEFGRPTTATALNDAVQSVGGLSGSRAAFVAIVPAQNIYLKGKFSAGGIQLRAVPVTKQQGTGGPDKFLFQEGAPSGGDLIRVLADRARRQSSERTVH